MDYERVCESSWAHGLCMSTLRKVGLLPFGLLPARLQQVSGFNGVQCGASGGRRYRLAACRDPAFTRRSRWPATARAGPRGNTGHQGCRRPFLAVWRCMQDTICTFRGVAHATRPAFLGLEALHVPRTQALDRARVASVGDVASRHGLHSIRFPRAGGSGSRVPLRLLLANA